MLVREIQKQMWGEQGGRGEGDGCTLTGRGLRAAQTCVLSSYILGFVRGMSNLNHWIYISTAHSEEGSSWACRCFGLISRIRLN
jgi:hypothetical protein